jgi:N-methylhydantoinase B
MLETTGPTARDYDPVVAEVISNRLHNIALEMATTLIRTSGSPVLTEAKDFSNAVFDRNVEHVGFSGYVVSHIGSSLEGVRAVVREYGEDVHPHDAFVCNDPYTAGALHQGDVGIVTPLFWRDELAGWAFSNAHVLDVGGMSPGGWAPVAYDCYGEAMRFAAVRIVHKGEFIKDIERLLLQNVRLPVVINDIRSLVAANNAAQSRLADLLEQYGLEEYERYCEINKQLTEEVIRERVAQLPDGIYEAVDWVEYDGHGDDGLWKVHARIGVSGSDLTIDFSDTDPQCDGFVNAGYGCLVGLIGNILMFTFAWDTPINAGLFRPVKLVMPPDGTVLNPEIPAPVSCGHMEGASKAGRVMWEAFSKALALADDPDLRRRAAAAGVFAWPGNSWAGLSQYGEYTAFAVMDCGSGGMGGQTVIDGLDVSSYETQLSNGIPDVEINEGFYPMLYLWRRLNAGSGGPGHHRGGQGLDLAWAPYGTESLTGTLENAMAAVPSRGMLGGYPGAAHFFKVVRDTELLAALAERRHIPQNVDELSGSEETLINHIAGVPLPKADVFRQITGGGAGMGDPVTRDPRRVARDVRDGYLSVRQAESAYGVVLGGDGEPDVPATTERRRQIRHERLGGDPAREPASPGEWRPALVLDGSEGEGTVCCGHCGQRLAPLSGNWKDGARVRKSQLAERLAEFGIAVKRRRDPAMLLYEWACPGCGSMLETNIYADDMEPLQDLRFGESLAELEDVGAANPI